MSNEIEQRILNTITSQLGVSPDSIMLTDSIKDDLGADSLDTVELIVSIEEEFGLTIDDDDCENWVTVNDVIDHIKNEVER